MMRAEYDFANAIENPYSNKEKKAVTVRLETDVVDYFGALASESGIPFSNLVNLYLRDCAEQQRKVSLVWNKKPD
jgi:hypothetical protein